MMMIILPTWMQRACKINQDHTMADYIAKGCTIEELMEMRPMSDARKLEEARKLYVIKTLESKLIDAVVCLSSVGRGDLRYTVIDSLLKKIGVEIKEWQLDIINELREEFDSERFI
jgi:hypothetical protein